MDMNKQSIAEKLEQPGIIPVIRLNATEKLFSLLEALIAGGVSCAELTMTIENAIGLLEKCKQRYGDKICLGMGTVSTQPQAQGAISAGAEFLVSPFLAFEALEYAQSRNIPFAMGAFSPTEIHQASIAGADYVKIFPINRVGIKYIKDVKGPMPEIKLIPTGGIGLNDIQELVSCGVSAMGVGGAIVCQKDIEGEDWAAITQKAKSFVSEINKYRKLK